MAKDGDVALKVLTPVKAIREKCIDCCCGDKNEVKRCHITRCALHPYRLGKNPNRKGTGPGNVDSLRKWREQGGGGTKGTT